MIRGTHKRLQKICSMVLALTLVFGTAASTVSAANATKTGQEGIERVLLAKKQTNSFTVTLENAKHIGTVELTFDVQAENADAVNITAGQGFSLTDKTASQKDGGLSVKATFNMATSKTAFSGDAVLATIANAGVKLTAVRAFAYKDGQGGNAENSIEGKVGYFTDFEASVYDLTQDGIIDGRDLNHAAWYFGTTSANTEDWSKISLADFSNDGKIGVADFVTLIGNYSKDTPPSGVVKPSKPSEIPSQPAENAGEVVSHAVAYVVENDHVFAFTLKDGNLDKHSFTVNGKTITPTPVNDEKTIGKFAFRTSEKIELVITNTTSKKTQTLAVSTGADAFTDVVAMPKTVLTSGPVSVFEYHLPPYDEEGKVRKTPSKTTFQTVEVETPVANGIKLWANPKSPANENVIIKYNEVAGQTDAWQEAITGIFVDFGGSTASRVPVAYTLGINGEYNGKTVRHIVLDTTSDHSYFKDRNTAHTVLIQATGYEDTRISFETVTENTGMSLSANHSFLAANPLTFYFNDNLGFPYNEVQNVYLDGQLLQGDCVDYHVVGDLITINCKETAEMNEKLSVGKHSLKVEVKGIETYEKKFTLREAQNGEKNPIAWENHAEETSVVSNSSGIDALSRSTSSIGVGSGSGGSGDSSGGGVIRANVIWDYDLLANAKLLQFMDKETGDSKAILAWWDAQTKDAIIVNDSNNILVDYKQFKNKVGENGTYKTLDDYYAHLLTEVKKNPNHGTIGQNNKITGVYYNRPYSVKHMLENGALGEIEFYFGNITSKSAPTLNVTNTTIDPQQDLVISYPESADDWAENLTAVKPNQYQMFQYTVDKSARTITISATKNKIPYGNLTLTISSEGYANATLDLKVGKVMEGALSAVKTEGATGDVVVTIPDKDFLKNMTKIALSTKTGALLSDEAVGNNGGDYSKTGEKLTLKFNKLFEGKNNGEQVTLTLSAYGYQNVQYKFTYDSLTNGSAAASVPAYVAVVGQTTIPAGNNVKITVANDIAASYLKAITAVLVGETTVPESEYEGSAGATVITIPSKYLKNGANTITIKARGYQDWTGTVTVDASAVNPVPNFVGISEYSSGLSTTASLELKQKTNGDMPAVYLIKGTYSGSSHKVDNMTISNGSDSKTIDLSTNEDTFVSLSSHLKVGTNTITISTTGYADKTMTITVEKFVEVAPVVPELEVSLAESNDYYAGEGVLLEIDKWGSFDPSKYSVTVDGETATLNQDKTVTSAAFAETGTYTIVVTQKDGKKSPKTLSVTIVEKPEGGKAVPSTVGLTKSWGGTDRLKNLTTDSGAFLYFDDDNYRKAITKITLVDAEKGTKELSKLSYSNDISIYSSDLKAGENTITVEATGYQTASFTITYTKN